MAACRYSIGRIFSKSAAPRPGFAFLDFPLILNDFLDFLWFSVDFHRFSRALGSGLGLFLGVLGVA